MSKDHMPRGGQGWMPGFRASAFLLTAGLIAIITMIAFPVRAEPAPQIVRLALVNVADDVVKPFIPEFQEKTGIRAEIVYMGSDPFSAARSGKADLIIAHYGHSGVEPFVTEGLGKWPKPIFANQMALFGPSGDPAKIRGISDAAQAFARIATSRSSFVANSSPGAKYLEQIFWDSAGVKEFGEWYIDNGTAGKAAIDAASKSSAYVLWGVAPFLRYKRKATVDLEPLVIGDALLQRMMVSIVVLSTAQNTTNAEAAKAFERYLIAPATQSRIRAFRYPGLEQQMWWPAGRHNGHED
jgi:tungstate transport system substrate-binding protein